VRARVVSLPCWEQFVAQDAAYRDAVLPPAVRARVAVEAGVSASAGAIWSALDGRVVGLDRYGASAPGEVLMEKLGFTVDAVVAAARVDRVSELRDRDRDRGPGLRDGIGHGHGHRASGSVVHCIVHRDDRGGDRGLLALHLADQLERVASCPWSGPRPRRS
jgi:hypothetical protein